MGMKPERPQRKTKFFQGVYKPVHPEKYKGNVKNIIYRSGWELKFLRHLDNDPNVIQYSSEEVVVVYKSIDGKTHRYFLDFWVKRRLPDGQIVEEIIEIKPFAQTQEPVKGRKKEKTFLNEVLTYQKNQAKWRAADQYAQRKGWKFRILTEKELGIK